MRTSKLVDVHDFYSPELEPYFKKLAEVQMECFGILKPSVSLDSKNWEIAMALYAFEKYNVCSKGKFIAVLGDDNFFLSEILSKSGSIVFSLDQNFKRGSNEIINQSNCFSEGVKENHIIFIQTHLNRLAIPSDFFDAIFVSGTSEHFAEIDSFQLCIGEIARVLKPEGLVSITAGFLLDGPEYTTTLGYQVPILTRELLQKNILQFSGLDEVDAFSTTQSQKTYEGRRSVINFLEADYNGAYTGGEGLIRYCDGLLFSTMHILLSKPIDWKRSEESQTYINGFNAKCSANRFLSKTSTNFDRNNWIRSAMLPPNNKIEVSAFFISILVIANDYFNKFPRIKRIVLIILSKFPFIYRFLRKAIHNKTVKNRVLDVLLRGIHANVKSSPILRSVSIKVASYVPGLLPALRKRLHHR